MIYLNLPLWLKLEGANIVCITNPCSYIWHFSHFPVFRLLFYPQAQTNQKGYIEGVKNTPLLPAR